MIFSRVVFFGSWGTWNYSYLLWQQKFEKKKETEFNPKWHGMTYMLYWGKDLGNGT
jgi:hypothetical protein